MSFLLACLDRDRRLALSRPGGFYVDAVSVLATAAGFFYLSRFVDHEVDGGSFFAFALPGLALMRLHAGIPRLLTSGSAHLADGTLEILLGSRRPSWLVIFGEAAFEMLRALVLALALLAVGVVAFGADVHLGAAAVAAVLLGLVAGMLLLLGLGTALLGVLLWLRDAGAAASVTSVILPVLGGAYFPLHVLPEPLETFARITPFHLPIDLMRTGLIEGRFDVGQALALVLGSAAALVLAAAFSVYGVRVARRAGGLASE
ncbi:MAG: transporter, permease protein [Solirubrobacterales bacterium]|nr:transporter, permease protein [Solirubrobacterales bacterium]